MLHVHYINKAGEKKDLFRWSPKFVDFVSKLIARRKAQRTLQSWLIPYFRARSSAEKSFKLPRCLYQIHTFVIITYSLGQFRISTSSEGNPDTALVSMTKGREQVLSFTRTIFCSPNFTNHWIFFIIYLSLPDRWNIWKLNR